MTQHTFQMSMEEEKMNPADPPPVFINLKVKAQDGSEVFFRINRNAPLKKLMNAFCDKKHVAYGVYVFLFDGDHIKGEHTAAEVGIEDGEEIDAMLHQVGGDSSPLLPPSNSVSH